MPILQSRLIALIHVADEILATYRTNARLARGIYDAHLRPGGAISVANSITSNPSATPDECRRACALLQEAMLGLVTQLDAAERVPEHIIETLAREREHFRVTSRKNDIAREALRARRTRDHQRPELALSDPRPPENLSTSNSGKPIDLVYDASRVLSPPSAPMQTFTREEYEAQRAERQRAEANASPIRVKGD